MLKKLAIILIFSILLIQGGILVFLFGTQQIVLKTYLHLKQTNCKEKNLLTFYFSQSKFDSLKIDAKEFKLNGEMYDIENTVSSESIVKVKAYKDTFEKNILSLIDKLTDKSSDDSSIPNVIKKISSLVFIFSQPLEFQPFAYVIDKKVSYYYKINCKDNYSMYLLKPPC